MIKIIYLTNILFSLIFLINLNKLPPQIPLFYTKPWGEDQLAELWVIFLIPFLFNFYYFINQYIKTRFFKENDFVEKLFFYTNLSNSLLGLLFFLRIILIIT